MKFYLILFTHLFYLSFLLNAELFTETDIFVSDGVSAFEITDANINTVRNIETNDETFWVHLYYKDEITVDSFAIAFEGDVAEKFRYSVAISENNRDWIALYDGWSRGDSSVFELMTFPEISGQFVQIRVSENMSLGIKEFILGDEASVLDEVEKYEPVSWGDTTDPEVIFDMLNLAYDWQQERPTTRPIGWIEGAYTAGVMWLYYASGDEQYRQDMFDKCEAYEWTLGEPDKGLRSRHADDHAIGQTYLELFALDPLEENEHWYELLKSCFDEILIADDMDYGNSSKDWWSWCDALFMAPPAWVQMAEVTGDVAYLDLVDDWWWNKSSSLLYDETEHLFYRDYKRISNVEPNGESEFWSRGNGWVVAGLVRVLEFMPEDHPTRSMYGTQLQEMLIRLAEIQSEDGLWRSSLLDPDSFEEPEVSGSAFFIFAMAYCVNQGLLDIETFGPVIEKGWQGLASALLSTGEIQWVQQVGADPQPNEEHYDKHYGTGAYLMAGAEVARYYQGNPKGFIPLETTAYALKNIMFENPLVELVGDVSQWTLIDDFESQSLTDWSVSESLLTGNGIYQSVEEPFTSSTNSVLELSAGDVQHNRLSVYSEIPEIEEGALCTIYQRIAFKETQLNVVWGAAHNDEPSSYSHFGPITRMTSSAIFDGRYSGDYAELGSDFMQLETWYEMWMLIDQSNDLLDIYIRGGTQYPEVTLLADDSEFRAATTDSLSRYFVILNNGSDTADIDDSALYIDDVYVDPIAFNLTRPEAVNQPKYSVWSDKLIERNSGAKFTSMDWMNDAHYPWVYNYLLQDWLYVSAESHSDKDIYLWSDNEQAWFWHSSDYHAWYYDYAISDWRWME